MATIDLLARCLIGWCVFSVIIGGAYALAMARHNQRTLRIDGAYPACVPVRPRITQVQVDETWQDAEYVDIDELEQRVYDRLFDDLAAWNEPTYTRGVDQ